MANNCFYTLKAAGAKESVQELLDIMQYKKEDTVMFARIFDAEEDDTVELADGRVLMSISGDCAWSVYSCMFEGNGTYFNSAREANPQLSSIPIESKRLGLDIEIYSSEPGMGFAEHYRVTNGDILISDETPYSELYWNKDEYPDFASFKEDYGFSDEVTEDQFDEDGYASLGGYDGVFEIDSLINSTT